MKTYMVGGAVRDQLLGRPPKDKDYVVVDASVADMEALGYRQVGKAFPVFLHPVSGEEYALARVERRTAGSNPHTAFEFVTRNVTLEEDLSRRDLTINAMALAEDGVTLIDPFHGKDDLNSGYLRHVSPAFAEDPLRVLRVARLAARYHDLGFQVHPSTLDLMRAMVENGDVAGLTAERVWGELQKALTTTRPSVFLQVLRECGALKVVLPEVDALYGIPQPEAHHPEVDTGIHMELVLDQAARLAPGDDRVGFAALVHDLGKALTPESEWPRHLGHEEKGKEPVEALSARLKVPAGHRQSGLDAAVHHLKGHLALEVRAGTLVGTMMSLDAFRQPVRWETFVVACEADARGRTGLHDRPYPQAAYLRDALKAARACRVVPKENEPGPRIAVRLYNERVSAVKKVFRVHKAMQDAMKGPDAKSKAVIPENTPAAPAVSAPAPVSSRKVSP